MRKTILLLITFGIFVEMNAQAPEKISYQAVIRDNKNELVCNQHISMQVSIIKNISDGEIVYSETQTPETSTYGMIAIEIGAGVSNGNFSSIDWSSGTYFVKTEIDVTGGNNYSITTLSQMLSVPFAFYAKSSGSSIPGPKGDTGKSAYDIWIEAGNSGTEIDFLASLRGPQGPAGSSSRTFAVCASAHSYYTTVSGIIRATCSTGACACNTTINNGTLIRSIQGPCQISSDTGSCSATNATYTNQGVNPSSGWCGGVCCLCAYTL